MKKQYHEFYDSNGTLHKVSIDACPECKNQKQPSKQQIKYTSHKEVGGQFWTLAVKGVDTHLSVLEGLLESGVDGILAPEVFAILQERFDKLGDRLWQKAYSEHNVLPVSQTQGITESLTQKEMPSVTEL